MSRTPTVYDVADRADVSIATVSRVLRNPDAVKDSTRDTVLAAIKDLGYVPSGNARGLAARRTNVIGLFLPGHDDLEISKAAPPRAGERVPVRAEEVEPQVETLYFDRVLRGAEIEAWRRGFSLMVGAGRGPAKESLVNDLAGRVDGLAVLSHTVSDELLAHVARRIPVVILAGADRDDGFDHVSVNNGPGMRAVTEHVLSKRPESITYIRGVEGSPDDEERFAGFEQALGDREAVIRRGDFTRESGRAVAREMTPTRAVICANDQMALGVLDVLTERGMAVPDEVMVTGFDGIDAGKTSTPSLTTVHQPMIELGRAAIHAITQRLEDPSIDQQQLTLPVQVVLRASCP